MGCRNDYMQGSGPCDECESQRRKLTKTADDLAAMLCSICVALDNANDINGWPVVDDDSSIGLIDRVDGLRTWWDNHQRIDAERIAREREAQARKDLRESALGKLTPEERKALGL